MVHMMRVAFNQSGFLHWEPRRCGLCISIKLLDEGARWLLLLFFCRYCLLSAPLPKISPPPFSQRQLKDPLLVAERSRFIWALRSPVFPASPFSLCRPDVSASSCKTEQQTASPG